MRITGALGDEGGIAVDVVGHVEVVATVKVTMTFNGSKGGNDVELRITRSRRSQAGRPLGVAHGPDNLVPDVDPHRTVRQEKHMRSESGEGGNRGTAAVTRLPFASSIPRKRR